jgi:hypothetical protein
MILKTWLGLPCPAGDGRVGGNYKLSLLVNNTKG